MYNLNKVGVCTSCVAENTRLQNKWGQWSPNYNIYYSVPSLR